MTYFRYVERSTAMSDDHTTRRTVLLGIGTTTAVALAGCSGGGDGSDGGDGGDGSDGGTMDGGTTTGDDGGMDGATANVRVAHLSPNAPNVDIYVDGEAAVEDVGFGNVGSYLGLPAGERQLRITPAGDGETTVAETALTVEADTDYTVAAVGEVGDEADQAFEVLPLTDDNSAPDEGMARVRVLHASPDAPTVDVTAGDGETVLFDGVSYGESGYVSVPADTYTLEIRGDTESNDGEVVHTQSVTVEAGQVYTAAAVGYLTPDDDPTETGFGLVLAQDTGGMDG
jgi:hypothetical protein